MVLESLLQANLPDVRWRILNRLDESSLLNCRLVSRDLRGAIDRSCKFNGKLSDKKLRQSVLNWQPVSRKSDRTFQIKKVIVGKLTGCLKNAPLGYSWDAVEEIIFTRAVSSRNYHALLKACGSVRVIRINYLAIGGHKKRSSSIFYRLIPSKLIPSETIDLNYFLPNLTSIFVDRDLVTSEFLENRNQKKFKHFDADLYFRTMADLIDHLEKEVQSSILELLRDHRGKDCLADPNSGFFFTKPCSVNRFPMNERLLNRFATKLRP